MITEAKRVANGAYYATHKDEKRAYNVAYNLSHKDAAREKKAEFREWIQILRANNGCEDCGVHEGWLEHHHVDPGTKKLRVSEMAGCSLDALEDELEKCVVLCHSCHGKRHVSMRQSEREN